MKNKKWKKFGKLTEKCYLNMIGSESDGSCWYKAFELLKEIILEERAENPDYAQELDLADDATDYEYDISGWLEDCLDELDMREEYEQVLKMCNDLLDLFVWPQYTDSEIKFRKASVLLELDRKEEAEKYCQEWLQKEPDNITAATACIYTYIDLEKYDAAEKLVSRFITDSSICTDENVIVFTAASKLYKATGDRKKKKQIDNALQDYEDRLEAYFDDVLSEEDDLDFFDGELPFE